VAVRTTTSRLPVGRWWASEGGRAWRHRRAKLRPHRVVLAGRVGGVGELDVELAEVAVTTWCCSFHPGALAVRKTAIVGRSGHHAGVPQDVQRVERRLAVQREPAPYQDNK